MYLCRSPTPTVNGCDWTPQTRKQIRSRDTMPWPPITGAVNTGRDIFNVPHCQCLVVAPVRFLSWYWLSICFALVHKKWSQQMFPQDTREISKLYLLLSVIKKHDVVDKLLKQWGDSEVHTVYMIFLCGLSLPLFWSPCFVFSHFKFLIMILHIPRESCRSAAYA